MNSQTFFGFRIIWALGDSSIVENTGPRPIESLSTRQTLVGPSCLSIFVGSVGRPDLFPHVAVTKINPIQGFANSSLLQLRLQRVALSQSFEKNVQSFRLATTRYSYAVCHPAAAEGAKLSTMSFIEDHSESSS